MFPVEVTSENNSEGNLSPITEDVYYGRVARHRTWSTRRHMGGTRSPHGMCLQSGFYYHSMATKCHQQMANRSYGHLQVPVSLSEIIILIIMLTVEQHDCTALNGRPTGKQFLGSRMNVSTVADDK